MSRHSIGRNVRSILVCQVCNCYNTEVEAAHVALCLDSGRGVRELGDGLHERGVSLALKGWQPLVFDPQLGVH